MITDKLCAWAFWLNRTAFYSLSLLILFALAGCAPSPVQALPTALPSQPQASSTPADIPAPPTAASSPSPETPTAAPTPTPVLVIRLGQVDKVMVRVDDHVVVQAPAGQWRLTYNPDLVVLLTREGPGVSSWRFQALAPGVTPITADMETPPCAGDFCPPAPVAQFSMLLEIVSP